MSGGIQMAPRNEAFAAKLALTYAELYDGISPVRQRVSLRIAEGVLELKNAETHAVTRWSLGKMREVADQSDETSMTFAADNYDPARLVVREVEALRALIKTGAEFKPLSGPRGQLIRLAIVGIFSFGGIFALLFGLIPWFADRAAERIPVDAEVAMGQEIFEDVYLASGAAECSSTEGLAALAAMETRLTSGVDIPYPLSIRVVREPSVNATAIPGGHITLHEGLLRSAESPDEVAAVVAHEIGHVVNRDGTRAYLRNMGSFGLVGLMSAMSSVSPGSAVASMAIDASYSREAEAAADAYAHDMMRNAGLPPEAMATFFTRLRDDLGPNADLGVLVHLSTIQSFLIGSRPPLRRAVAPVGRPL